MKGILKFEILKNYIEVRTTMAIQLISHNVLGKVKGKDALKYKFRIRMEDGTEYIVLKWDGVDCIVYDARFDEELSKFTWS